MPRQIHILFNLLALFFITYMVVVTFYNMISMKLFRITAPNIAAFRDNEMHGDQAFSSPEYPLIVKRNIFKATENVESTPMEEKPEVAETLKETTLKLSLLGTIAGDTESSRAIIMDQRARSQDIYRVADSIQGAKIKQILRGKVVLRHGEKYEILSMAGDEEVTQVSSRVEQRGRPYFRRGDLTPTGDHKEIPERIKARKSLSKVQQKALAAKNGPAENLAKTEDVIFPAQLSLLNKPSIAVPQATMESSTGDIKQFKESNIPTAKVPDFAAIEPFIASWVNAWKQKNIETYLSYYAEDFNIPGGISREAWEKKRHQRLDRPKFIRVQISGMEKQKVHDSRAWVTFIQEYQSDIYADKVVKTLELEWGNGVWLIAKETSRTL